MSKVRLGPLSEIHYSKLLQLLNQAGATAERFEDPDLLATFVDTEKKSMTKKIQPLPHHSSPYPLYGAGPEFIFIEIEKEFLLIIRAELEKIGIAIPGSNVSFNSGLTFAENSVSGIGEMPAGDFICPLCKFTAEYPGNCPKDQTPLVDYFVFTKKKKQSFFNKNRIIAVLFLLASSVGVFMTIYNAIFGSGSL